MIDVSGVLLLVLGFAGCVVALAGIILPPRRAKHFPTAGAS